MIVANLWFIKHSNGLFHYGLDYAEALGNDVREFWVRDEHLGEAVRKRLPSATVKAMSAKRMLIEVARAGKRGDLLFTASSHPLALSSRLVVVVHDSFPFKGLAGRAKKLLFRLGLHLTRGWAAYVNEADGRHFLQNLGITETEIKFMPNKIANASCEIERSPLVSLGNSITIGLFGTDSPKKNYEELFDTYSQSNHDMKVIWRIYGHNNDYTKRLMASYPDCSIHIIDSDSQTMEEFIAGLDLAVSPARDEGFARPIALALMRGVPTFLLDIPVFREFYAGSALLFANVESLVSAITALREGDSLERPSLQTEATLRVAFEEAIAWLRSR